MGTNEFEKKTLEIDKNAQINVMLNTPDYTDYEIDLGRVFHNMKQMRRVYAWVIVLCLLVGVCAPLLLYQFSKPVLTVSSVVTLNYAKDERLKAPDGTDLDLSQIVSSYVLQNALADLKLSKPVSISALRSNIKIDRILTDKSRQAQELAKKMDQEKNANVFNQLQSIDLEYVNRFVVSLTNSFDDGTGKNTIDLKDAELRLVLNRVLDAYNDYLILTYADQKLPEDRLSIIDLDRMDILESLEQMQTASDALNNYCQSQSDEVKAYRSWKTGFNLNDWMEFLQMLREVNIDYLYSYVYTNGYVKNKSTMLMNYQYQLRNEQSNLDQINSNIQTLDSILKDYKKDNIFVSMQESGTSKSTSTTTDYFNQLIMDQVTNYSTVAQTETRISNLNDQIEMLSVSDSSSNLANVAENINTELVRALEASRNIYSQIKAHMEEVQASPEFTHFAVHTAASGEQKNFLSANLTKMIIGFVLGGVIGCGLWFMASLLPELTRSHSRKESKKEADA